jgi:hypothetical protein
MTHHIAPLNISPPLPPPPGIPKAEKKDEIDNTKPPSHPIPSIPFSPTPPPSHSAFSPSPPQTTPLQKQISRSSLRSHANKTLHIRHPLKLRQVSREICGRFERSVLVFGVAAVSGLSVSKVKRGEAKRQGRREIKERREEVREGGEGDG